MAAPIRSLNLGSTLSTTKTLQNGEPANMTTLAQEKLFNAMLEGMSLTTDEATALCADWVHPLEAIQHRNTEPQGIVDDILQVAENGLEEPRRYYSSAFPSLTDAHRKQLRAALEPLVFPWARLYVYMGTELVAVFDDEDTYAACTPALEALAAKRGLTLTESVK
jgi:hypothetical protein